MDTSQITLAVSALVFSLAAGLFYFKNINKFWKFRGVPGPEPWLLAGHLPTILLGDRIRCEREWPKKYGKVYGIFYGCKPRLMIADPDVILQICVRDFEHFQNHELTEFTNKYQRLMIFNIKDDHWKRVRSLMSPTFTSAKIKRMFKLINHCVDDLVQCFLEQMTLNAIVNLKDTYNLFTMDVISTCCYGLKLERAGSTSIQNLATRDDLANRALAFFEEIPWRFFVNDIVPKPLLRLLGFEVRPCYRWEPIAEKMRDLVRFRRSSKKFDDYLQLLIDAKMDSNLDVRDTDVNENHHAGLTQESVVADRNKMIDQVRSATNRRDLVLSEMDIIANAIFLLAVGLETTGSLLTNCSHALAFHPVIQEKLHQKLLSIVEYSEDKSEVEFTYEALTSCKYLDAVISETLRFLSPVIQMDRVASSDYTIEKYGFKVKKGDILNLSLHSIMHDPDYWPNCDKFDPERFMPENKDKIYPGSYCPFGLGPRHCLGMRFSLTESKLALAKIIMKFRFEPAPGTKFADFIKNTIFLSSLRDSHIKLVVRD